MSRGFFSDCPIAEFKLFIKIFCIRKTDHNQNEKKSLTEWAETESKKVPLSASGLVRKDFGIREDLRKAPGGKNQKSYDFRRGKKKKKDDKNPCLLYEVIRGQLGIRTQATFSEEKRS